MLYLDTLFYLVKVKILLRNEIPIKSGRGAIFKIKKMAKHQITIMTLRKSSISLNQLFPEL